MRSAQEVRNLPRKSPSGTTYWAKPPTPYTLAAEPSLRLTLPQAVEVLNRVGHGGSQWILWRDNEVWRGHVGSEMISAFSTIALAEYYLRHGLTAWPGWEWEGE